MRVLDFVGIPFARGGDDLRPEGGADCRGLTLGILAAFGRPAVDPGAHALQVLEQGGDTTQFIPPGWTEIPAADVQPLDVLYMEPGNHYAIVGEAGWVLETTVGRASRLVSLRAALARSISAWRTT